MSIGYWFLSLLFVKISFSFFISQPSKQYTQWLGSVWAAITRIFSIGPWFLHKIHFPLAFHAFRHHVNRHWYNNFLVIFALNPASISISMCTNYLVADRGSLAKCGQAFNSLSRKFRGANKKTEELLDWINQTFDGTWDGCAWKEDSLIFEGDTATVHSWLMQVLHSNETGPSKIAAVVAFIKFCSHAARPLHYSSSILPHFWLKPRGRKSEEINFRCSVILTYVLAAMLYSHLVGKQEPFPFTAVSLGRFSRFPPKMRVTQLSLNECVFCFDFLRETKA